MVHCEMTIGLDEDLAQDDFFVLMDWEEELEPAMEYEPTALDDGGWMANEFTEFASRNGIAVYR